MSGLALIWDPDAQEARLVVADAQTPDAALQTAVIISLFTDGLAEASDDLPDENGDRRGWWGDVLPPVEGDRIGGRLWLGRRGKRRAEDLRQHRERAAEALAWMVEDGVASTVTVDAAFLDEDGIQLLVAITRPNGQPLRFDFLWNKH